MEKISFSSMEQVMGSKEPFNLSSGMIEEAGKRMSFREETIAELINPQDVRIFRLPIELFGKIINVWGCIVLHNNARGPYKGGIRLAGDVDVWETTELARLMTLKTAVNGIEFGGGKTGIRLDMKQFYNHFGIETLNYDFERAAKRSIFKVFANKFRDLFVSHEYIPAPDMGSSGEQMTEIYNITGDPASVTGKPEGVHGWLNGRKESTGFGVAVATLGTLDYLGISHNKATVAIQGFGNVASYTARYLTEKGVKVLGVVDISGGVYSKNGLDIQGLLEYTQCGHLIKGFPGESLTSDQLFSLPVDVLIPAATGHVLNGDNSKVVQAKAVVCAANMPITSDGMKVFDEKGIFVFPDIVANAGGVIASNMEYSGSLSAQHRNKEAVFNLVESKITDTFKEILEISQKEKINLSESAILLAVSRIRDSMLLRGWLSSTSCDITALANGNT